jgi:dUTP pyrophosphatase
MNVILDEGAFLPISAHKNDAGYDLFSRTTAIIPARSRVSFDIGVHVELPEGSTGFIKSRSGLNRIHGLTCEGVVDKDYTGSICVTMFNHSDAPYIVNEGERIAQMVILPILKPGLEVVKEFEETARGNNGFGSSGK